MAMLAKGPAWMKQGCPSMVCSRFGFSASTIQAVIAPATPRSSVVIDLPRLLLPMTILPMRSRMSFRS